MKRGRRRPYVQRRRAELAEGTRARILDAVISLHEEVGPSRTTVSAIARRAGVQRLTVYRHFPDERLLLEACASRWISEHPPPDPTLWIELEDPVDRTHLVLSRLFAYYRRTARMWTTAHRDAAQVPALGPAMARFEDYLRSVGDGLLDDWGDALRPEARALVRHALRFTTWTSLAREGLDDDQMATLLVDWLVASGARAVHRSEAV